MIKLLPTGGLANRLRAIASALKLAAQYGDSVVVNWQITSDLACRFDKLFDTKPVLLFFEYTKLPLHKPLLYLSNVIFKAGSIPYTDINAPADRMRFLQSYEANPAKVHRIRSFDNFFDAHDYSFLTPSAEITQSVNDILGKTTRDKLVGVQIRRTDNAKSIANSPTEAFIEAMRAEEQADPEVKFYLATDDISTRQQIRQLFGDKVLCLNSGSVNRITEAGMLDAAVDFIALSRCRKIYGSYWSSFCEVAADVGGCELEVVKN